MCEPKLYRSEPGNRLRHSMKVVFVLLVLLISSLHALADSPQCQHQGQMLDIGQSVYVFDPVIVNQRKAHLQKTGKSDTEIKALIETGDWLGYRLVCQATYEINPNPNLANEGDILIPTGVALVLTEISQYYYQNRKEAAQ